MRITRINGKTAGRYRIHKVKPALVAGALLCMVSFAACGDSSDGGKTYRVKSTESTEASTQTTTTEQSTDNTETASSDNANNMSYNAFLYQAKTSLSDPVGIDDFGYDMSKQNNNADRRLQNGPYGNTKISLSEEHLQDFVKIVNSEEITYKYEDLYDIPNAEKAVEAYSTQIADRADMYTDLICDINEIPSKETLMAKIESNSSEYLPDHKNYDAVGSEYTELIADAVINVLTEYHDELDEDTLRKVYCMLNDVKVVGIDSSDFTKNIYRTVFNAAVMDDGAVVLDPAQIDKLRQADSLEKTIYHEVIHLFQRQAADARIVGLTQIGGSQYVDSFVDTGEVNSLHFQWLYESCAEFMSMHMNDSKKPVVYANMVGYLNTLNTITLIRPDYQEDSIPVSQMSNDPEKIYEVLGATPEEKNEIRNMLYSISCISDNREDFGSVYDAQYGEGSLVECSTEVKDDMRTSIGKTMTKLFYRNLAERVADTDVTLEDVYYIINVFEGALSRHLWYDDSSLYSLFEDTMRYYVDTQDKFFEYIAEDSGYTYDQVVDDFNSFAMVYSDGGSYVRNCSFDWLDEDEKTYIGDVFTTNIKDFTINIRKVVEEHGK